MTYVDGFVCSVPTAKRAEYAAFAKRMAAVFREHGAIRVADCWGDDVPDGKLTSFPLAVKRAADETVVFSWIEWPSQAARREAWKELEKHPLMQPASNPMPFDGKRMIYGGFAMLNED
jgi:uncharacterized protein YbaA (DUF1428 family)